MSGAAARSDSRASAGIGFPSLLFLVFLVLKLTGVVSWSWWWVTAPLWIPWALLVLFVIVGVVIAALTGGKTDNVNRNRLRGL